MQIKTSIQLLVIGSIIFLASCNKSESEPIEGTFDPLLLNCWTNSYEEEVSDALHVYRPCNFKEWPPSRYREIFTLKNDFKATYLVLAPNDAHYFEDGTWKYYSETKLLQIINQAGKIVREYKIIDIKMDKLLLTNNQ